MTSISAAAAGYLLWRVQRAQATKDAAAALVSGVVIHQTDIAPALLSASGVQLKECYDRNKWMQTEWDKERMVNQLLNVSLMESKLAEGAAVAESARLRLLLPGSEASK